MLALQGIHRHDYDIISMVVDGAVVVRVLRMLLLQAADVRDDIWHRDEHSH